MDAGGFDRERPIPCPVASRRRTRGPRTGGADVLVRTATGDRRAEVRQAAVVQLGYDREPSSVPVLRAVLRRDADPRVRGEAAAALGRRADWEGLNVLVEAAERDECPRVRDRAVGAIQKMGSVRFGYSPSAPEAERREALQRMRRWMEGRLIEPSTSGRPQ